jgi:hypothetical protein
VHTFLHFSHVTSDFGPGPFEIDPHYNSQTGVATFTQALYNNPSPGVWNLDHRVPLATIGVFHLPADYQFPLNSFVLLNSQRRIVAKSPKTDYCITGDYQLSNIPNSPDSTSPSPANCADPTLPLGWSVGWGDHYDQTDNGQPINISKLPNGTYTLRGIVDPTHVFTETNRTNDVTDTKLSITGIGTDHSSVTVLSQSHPDLPLPTVRVTAPTAGQSVSGTVALKATASTKQGRVTSVQFLVDGRPIGSPDTSAPFARSWQTGAANPGKHLVSARVTTSQGIMNTSRQVSVTVQAARATADRARPTVAVLNPIARETVSGTVPLAANVTDDVGIAAVRFFVDGHAIGVARRSPYAIRWKTTDVASGRHILTARAVDRAGHTATTRQVVQVQNPAPPMTCFVVQSIRNAQGKGAVSTPAFRTAVGDEVLLAMVSADGPSGAASQSATVRGGGLTWHLVKRANGQQGDAEVWSAKVHRVRLVGPVTSRLSAGGHAQKLTVVALEGVERVGASVAADGTSGSPHAALAVTGEGSSLVFAAGASAVARRPALPTGQVFAARGVDRLAGATFWSQYTNQAVSPAGTSVTMRALRPTSGPWNFVAVEAVGELE